MDEKKGLLNLLFKWGFGRHCVHSSATGVFQSLMNNRFVILTTKKSVSFNLSCLLPLVDSGKPNTITSNNSFRPLVTPTICCSLIVAKKYQIKHKIVAGGQGHHSQDGNKQGGHIEGQKEF